MGQQNLDAVVFIKKKDIKSCFYKSENFLKIKFRSIKIKHKTIEHLLILTFNSSNHQINLKNLAKMIDIIQNMTASNQPQSKLENLKCDVQNVNHWKHMQII